MLCCQVLISSHQFTFRFLNLFAMKPGRATIASVRDGTYVCTLVWRVCCVVSNTGYSWIIFGVNWINKIIRGISYLFVLCFWNYIAGRSVKAEWLHFAHRYYRRLFERCSNRISFETPSILTEIFLGFCKAHQGNSGTVSH